MEVLQKVRENLGSAMGGCVAGGTISVPLLWTGSLSWILILKFVGVLATAGATAVISAMATDFYKKKIRPIFFKDKNIINENGQE